MKRLPIRLKLTLAFTAVMALVLAATGLFLYSQLRAQLDHSLAQSLDSRSRDISALVQQSDTGLKDAARQGSKSGPGDSGFAQILNDRGRVIDATVGLQRIALLSSSQLAKATLTVSQFDLAAGGQPLGPARLLAVPTHAQGQRLVVVVGSSLEDRNQALSNLSTLLLVGGPAALLLTALTAYAMAGAALRPVESMRARAAAISAAEVSQRLPLSPGRDELRRLGETLNEMLARLEEGLKRERSFVGDASHELRTPVAMLKTELELMARDRPSGEELDSAVDSAISDTNRLASLIDDLLVLARADRDRLPLDMRLISVADLLAGVAARYPVSDVAVAPEVQHSAPSSWFVRGDPDRLSRALVNLVDNALRHGASPVRLSAVRRDGLIEFHVRDNGPGIPAMFLPRAFERFARADSGHTGEGTGLGLAIVRTIAESHGGSAHAENQPGGGADVWITVPLGPPSPGHP